MYPPQVIDHFEHPRNAGEIAEADGQARVENPACGDIMQLQVRVRSGRIVEARYKTRGCVAAIAAGSALTEMITGLSVAEAQGLERQRLVAELGGLSPESMHASHLAMDALRETLGQLQLASGR